MNVLSFIQKHRAHTQLQAEEIQELAQIISYHQQRYYNGEPEISDAQFDVLWDMLRAVAPNHRLLQQVGVDKNNRLTKRKHRMVMGSLEKAADAEEFLRWAERMQSSTYLVQYKLDGASLELQYENGALLAGVTRGDGVVGDDITHNVKHMYGVPQALSEMFSGSIRGEVIMTHDVHARHFPEKMNCRNAANGVMKRKDGKGSKYLRILCYDIFPFTGTEKEKMQMLYDMGMQVVPWWEFHTAEDVVRHHIDTAKKRKYLDYDIDGLVVKTLQTDEQDIRRMRPQKAVAFKFAAQDAITVLRNVEWSGYGHIYTPVGITDPVQIAGTTVHRASLVHPELIRNLALRIGSRVLISKRGDIIPKIEKVVGEDAHVSDIVFPTHCFTCNTELINEGKRLYCPNTFCDRRKFHRLQKWLDVLNVKDFGIVLLQKLFTKKQVKTIRELYNVQIKDIMEFEGMGKISAEKVLTNLHSKHSLTLEQFIAGFDIEGVGELTVRLAVNAGYDTLEKLAQASVEDLSMIKGLGEKKALQMLEGVKNMYTDMQLLFAKNYVTLVSSETVLTGQSFCFTGALVHCTRNQAAELVRQLGGEVRTSVSAELSFLVTNNPHGNSQKLVKARALGIHVISEKEFLEKAGQSSEGGREIKRRN